MVVRQSALRLKKGNFISFFDFKIIINSLMTKHCSYKQIQNRCEESRRMKAS